MKITILGAGAYGSALGQVLEENGHVVRYYDPKLEASLEEALEGAEMMLLVAPSNAVAKLLPRLDHHLPLIIATKGLLTDEIFADFANYMIISGPGFAKDIKAHQATKLTATDPRVVELFANDYMSFDTTADRRGVVLCGSLKNVYALMAGHLNLKPGTEAHEQFLAEVSGEMREILAANGGEPKTVDLACGIGDLRSTCGEPSRNYQFGRRLRWDPDARPEATVEGLSALKRIRRGVIKVPASAAKLRELLILSRSWGKNAD